jgi:hypothetical protein
MKIKMIGVAAVVGLLGCGGNGNGFSTGVDPSKPLGSLDQNEFNQICASVRSWLTNTQDRTRKLSCQVSAVSRARVGATTDADIKLRCQQRYDECVAGLAAQGDAGAPRVSTTTCTKPPASCTATVGEYEACVNDTSAEYDRVFGMVPTCSSLTLMSSAMLNSTNFRPMSPASCQALSTKCGTQSVMSSGGNPPPVPEPRP